MTKKRHIGNFDWLNEMNEDKYGEGFVGGIKENFRERYTSSEEKTEKVLDRAKENGVKTYVRRGGGEDKLVLEIEGVKVKEIRI